MVQLFCHSIMQKKDLTVCLIWKDLRLQEVTRSFIRQKAEVFNNLQIKVTCDKVAQPVAVRYCFRDFQPGNVANLRELPLYPFRTDNWE